MLNKLNLEQNKIIALSLGIATLFATATPALAEDTLTFEMPNGDKNITVNVETTFTIKTPGLTAPITYNTVDTHPDTTFSSTNISSDGKVKWKPSYNELGMHTITVTASGANNVSAVGTQAIIVNLPKAVLTAGTVTPGTTVPAGSGVSFDVTPSGFSYPSYTLTDSFGGSSLTSSNMSTSGNFSWTPTAADVGTHAINITGRDFRGSSASVVVSINVVPAGSYVTPAVTSVTSVPTTPVTTQYVAPTPAPTVLGSTVFTSFLNIGSKGSEVTALQTLLTSLGYYTGEITGYFGPATAAAVKKFQIAKGIDPQGYVGPSTRAALNGGAVAGVTTTSVTVTNSSTMSASDRSARIAALRVVIQYLQSELDKLVAGQ